MANNRQQIDKKNIPEQGILFFRDVHIAIGAVALAGAVVFPQFNFLTAVAAYEGINALAHEGLRQVVKNHPNRQLKAT